MSKIGVGIITHDRRDFFERCFKSLPDYVDVYVVNTSEYPLDVPVDLDTGKYYDCKTKTCVGHGKNRAIEMILRDGIDHIFTMEDDIEIIDDDIFRKYIKASEVSGIKHFNFGFSHKENLDNYKNPRIKYKISYDDQTSLIFTQHVLGALTYYHRSVLEDIGIHDDKFDHNHMDHVELTYRASKSNYHTPFWWFADIDKSWEMIHNLSNMEDDSIVRNETEVMKYFTDACMYFKTKHGRTPMEIPDDGEDNFRKVVREIYKNGNKL